MSRWGHEVDDDIGSEWVWLFEADAYEKTRPGQSYPIYCVENTKFTYLLSVKKSLTVHYLEN